MRIFERKSGFNELSRVRPKGSANPFCGVFFGFFYHFKTNRQRMKLSVIFLGFLSLTLVKSTYILSHDFIGKINRLNSTWMAGPNYHPDGWLTALDNGQYVGHTSIDITPATQDYTATDPFVHGCFLPKGRRRTLLL